MCGKLAKLAIVAMIVSTAFANVEKYEKTRKERLQDIFDNDSDFMRGFETGLFLRTKGGTIEEYGCRVPTDGQNKKAKTAFDLISSNIEMARNNLKLDPIIDEALVLLETFMDSLLDFINILSPGSGPKLDMYCTGMVFGLQGSKLLVKVANSLVNPVNENGEVAGTFEKKKGPSPFEGVLDNIGKGLLNTVKNTFSAATGGKSDEL